MIFCMSGIRIPMFVKIRLLNTVEETIKLVSAHLRHLLPPSHGVIASCLTRRSLLRFATAGAAAARGGRRVGGHPRAVPRQPGTSHAHTHTPQH
jgi:hypothetical protein